MAQGFAVEPSMVYQDNQSAILLEKNGRGSSSKRTRHIDIRYFFVTDRIQNKEVQVSYCPTGIMLADYFTKALQGIQFRTFRDQIMNSKRISIENIVDPDSVATRDHRSVLGSGSSTGLKHVNTRLGSEPQTKRAESS
jgi:hypothetical protein